MLVLRLDTPYRATQIVPDASVGTIFHTCGATTDNGPAAHSKGLSPFKLHEAHEAAARRSAADGERSPDHVRFSGQRRLSATCSGLCTSAPTEERLAQRFGGAISIEIEITVWCGRYPGAVPLLSWPHDPPWRP